MNTPEINPPATKFSMSPEAIIGTGVTIASIGVLFLLLGWAQWMRQVHDASVILLAIGGVLFVLGLIGALMGRTGKKR